MSGSAHAATSKARTPQVTVTGERSERGLWEMAVRGPHPFLAGSVQRYAGYIERSREPLRRMEAPFGGVVIILSFGERLELTDAAGDRGEQVSFAAGLSDAPSFTRHAGSQHGLQVDLAPPAARALLGIPLEQLTNVAVSLEDLLGARVNELLERLYDTPTWLARFDLLDRWLGRRLDEASRPSEQLDQAWRALVATGGRADIAGLARDVGYSRRRFSTLFRRELGLPPKTFARVLRFERAGDLVASADGTRLAEIAQHCGYYDQAHMNRDFRQFAGMSPTAYAGRLLPDPSDADHGAARSGGEYGTAGEDGPSLQDGGSDAA